MPCLTWSDAGADVDAVGLPDERLRVHAGQYSGYRGASTNLKPATDYSIFEAWTAAR